MEERKIDLNRKFPEMKPLKTTPSLSTINGIGTCVYGKRDYDVETGTYVKTHMFVVFFIPVFAMGAYRVADAQGSGWYFLGKVPLSFLASTWNKLVAFCMLMAVGGIAFASYWGYHTSQPEYKAERKLETARQAEQSGDMARAMSTYYGHIREKLPYADQAQQGLTGIVEEVLKGEDLRQKCKAYEILLRLQKLKPPVVIKKDLGSELVVYCDELAHENPILGSAFLNTVRPMWAEKESWDESRFKMLLARIARNPKDIDAADALAMIYESHKDMASCRKLLEPVRDQLGARESARVLGSIYMEEAKFEEAYDLLNPYVSGRIDMLKKAEEKVNKAYEKAWKDALAVLNRNQNSKEYKRLSGLPKKKQELEVDKYVSAKAVKNPNYLRAMAEFEKMMGVVGVAMDLGFLQLNRAKSFADPEKRKEELEAAEKTFLAVRSVAGGSDNYNLSLGQVYYWLGKEKEGRALIDGIAQKNADKCQGLFPVIRTLREIGERPRALALGEVAYKCAKTKLEKGGAASICAAMAADNDDRIKWLQRVPDKNNNILAQLAAAQGNEASENGDSAQAERHFRRAVGLYAKLPKNSTTMNNCSLCYFSLYGVTGDVECYREGVKMLEKVANLERNNALLLNNLLAVMCQGIVLDLVENKVDLKLTKYNGSADNLDHFYEDAKGHKAFLKKVTKHPSFEKAEAYLERLFVLAPKSVSAYSCALTLYAYREDEKALDVLHDRLQTAGLDLSEVSSKLMEAYRGPSADEEKEQLAALAKKGARLVQELATCNPAKQPISYSILCDDLIGCRFAELRLGKTTDLDKLVELARSMRKVNPSENSRGNLISALSIRGLDRIAKRDSIIAAFMKKHFKLLRTKQALAIVMNDPQRARIVAADPDIKEVIALLAESMQRFPKQADPHTWAILRTPNPALAEKAKTATRNDRLGMLVHKVGSALAPHGMGNVLQDYWHARAEGNDTRARAILVNARKNGVPIPDLLM